MAHRRPRRASTALWVLHRILQLLHPLMPFITEELWDQLGPDNREPLIVTDWPTFSDAIIDEGAEAEMEWLIRLVSAIRAVRSEMNVPPGARIPMIVR